MTPRFKSAKVSAAGKRTTRFVLLVGFLVLVGCAGTVPHSDQPPGVMDGVPHGMYAVTFHVRGIGPFCGSTTALMAAEPTAGGFRANSRPRAVADLLGGLPGFYLNLVGDKRFPEGAFLHWDGPAPVAGQVTRSVFKTPRAELHADFSSYDRPIELRPLNEERLFGLVTLKPVDVRDFPKTDYSGLIDRIDAELQTHLFDAAAYDEPGTRKFLRQLRKAAEKARDDAEFVMAWMLCSRHLKFSHCYIGRKLDTRFEERLSETSAIAPVAPSVENAITVTGDNDIVTLRIRSFEGDSYEGIDRAFDEIIARNPRGLIIDLRDNPGGTYISGRVAAHLIDAEINMGVFFNREARSKVLKGELDDFPKVMSISSEDEFNSLIRDHGAFVGVVDPIPPIFRGPVVVLTNERTASACEPLAAGLQEIKRATIVGERTAALMLWTTGFDVGGGWMLWIPTVDYLTGKGVRLDRVGVVPDIKASSEAAPQAALKCLNALLEGD